MGLVETVRNPVKSAKAIGGATWQTWSPLFHGDFAKFGQQVYDHPLAPLLDVATVFTLGAAGAARGAGAVGKVGATSARLEKLAGLAKPKSITIHDPKGERLPQERHLSDRPGRRLLQEIGANGPQWYVGKRNEMRYEQLHNVDMSGRVKATHEIQMAALMKAGQAITDPETAPRALGEIAGGMYAGLLRHNGAVPVEEAARLVQKGHFRYTTDVRQFDPQANRLIKRARKEEATWHKRRESNAELAHALPGVEKQLADAKRDLERAAGKADVDLERKVADLEKIHDGAQAAKAAHGKALTEIERLTEWRTGLEQRSYSEYFRSAATSLEDFTRFATGFGKRVSTRFEAKAAHPKVVVDGKWVDDYTRVYIHPLHDAKMLGKEAANSASFLGKAYKESTSFWKTVQLGYTPRTVTNNAVGNWVLAAARDNPVSTAVGLYDAIRITKGPEAAVEAALGGTMHATPFKKNHWMYREFADELGNTFKQTLADETGRLPGKLRQGLYPIVHKLSDEPVRMAVISTFLRKSPEVRAIKKAHPKLTTDQAISRALRTNRGLRDRASHHSRTTAGDYYTMQGWERTARDLVPFYLWDRHILKTALNMAADTPGRVAIAQRISNLGIERTEDYLGELPEFLRGAIPLGKKGGRADVLLTHSLNPFATVADLAGAAEALTTGGGVRPGSSVLSQMNPLITGGIEAATGRSILTGAEKDGHGGLLTTLAANTVLGFPQVRLAQALISPDTETTEAGNPKLYASDDRSPLTSFLGVPLRNISLDQAAAMLERDKPKKKKKRKSRFDNA